MMLFTTGLLKFFIGLIGVIGTIVLLFLSAFKRTRTGKLQYAVITFLTTLTLILLITGLEFLMYPTNSKLDQLVLTAHREAPLGAYWLGVYNDSTWELGNSSSEIEVRGRYTISGDTLYLKTVGGRAFYSGDTRKAFVIQGDDLIEVENTGINGLKIGTNKLNGL